MQHIFFAAVVAALALFEDTATYAADYTRVFSFEASSFSPVAPTDPVNGTFKVTYDTDPTHLSADVTVETLNIPVDSVVGATYSTGQDLIQVGGELNGVNGIAPGSNDFDLAIYQATSQHPTASFSFSDGTSAYRAGVTGIQALAVPETRAWVMILTGFAIVGGIMRSRRSAVVPSA